jgi:acylphosphatase
VARQHEPSGGDGPSPERGVVARRLVVHGRVQGVYFRAATRATAHRAGVVGWVANRADGTVEAWLEGPPDAVEQVEAWIVTGGPPSAVVTDVDLTVETPAGHAGFVVRR